jgi:hypothetical protein
MTPPRNATTVLGALLVVAAGACKSEHPPAVPPPPAAAAAAPPAPASTSLAAAASAPAPHDVDTFAADPHRHMKEHFVRAIKMQDAILAANLTEARAQGRWLATHQEGDVPKNWPPFVKAFHSSANAVANASTIDEAAAAVSHVAAACGECHAANHVKPRIGSTPVVGGARNVKAHMAAQLDALDRLWDGLMIPSGEAWHEGATLLARVAVSENALEKEGLDKADSARLLGETLRRLSATADKATSADRPKIYAELVTTCVACHVAVRKPVSTAAVTTTVPDRR